MAKRSEQQKIGSRGHKWVMSEIEGHPHWLARDLSEDFGVDAEAELTVDHVNGAILKLQFKSSQTVTRSNGKVRFEVDRKYIEYAQSCRYPVIFVRIDVTAKQAWFLWLQEWSLHQRAGGNDLNGSQRSYRIWVEESKTLVSGLDSSLQDIAQWRGETQLILSLLDAMRAAVATYNSQIITQLIALLSSVAPMIAHTSLDTILREAVYLGNSMLGTLEGLAISEQLFSLVRRFGDRVSTGTVDTMVRRGESYSRTGIMALGILYDEHFEHISSLELAEHFQDTLPEVAYYCALREANPGENYWRFLNGPGDFVYGGLRFHCPPDIFFGNKYANRGPSAILDYLIDADGS